MTEPRPMFDRTCVRDWNVMKMEFFQEFGHFDRAWFHHLWAQLHDSGPIRILRQKSTFWWIYSILSSIGRAWETETWWKWHFLHGSSYFDKAQLHHLWSEVKYFCIFEFLEQKSTNKQLFRFLPWFLSSEIQHLEKSSKMHQNPIQIWPKNGNFRPFHWLHPQSYLSEILSNSHYLDHFERKKVWPKHFCFKPSV